MLTIEQKTEKRIDISQFDKKRYFECVQVTANMKVEEISALIDRWLNIIDIVGPSNVTDTFKEKLAIFGYLAARRRR